MADTTLETIIKVEHRRAGEKVHLAYLKQLYNSVKIVDENFVPEWGNCFNIAFADKMVEDDLAVILNTAAAYLQHHGKIAIELAQSNNAIFIKTQVIQ